MYRVQDIMTDRVVTIGPDATIDEAVSLLVDNRVSGLPVVDDNQRLLGVISEIDIIGLVYDADIEASSVGDHMTRAVRTLDAQSSLDDAASIFCTQAIRRIPVIKDGRLVGVVSRRDLIRFVRDVRKQGTPTSANEASETRPLNRPDQLTTQASRFTISAQPSGMPADGALGAQIVCAVLY